MTNVNQQSRSTTQARAKAEKQIDKIIDHYAAKIPGASQHTDKAKGAVGTILKKLETSGERRMGVLSGLFGATKRT